MYSYIKGKVDHKTSDYFVLENNGIGFKISSALSTLDKLELSKEVKAYTYIHVREDLISLYGFLTNEELRVFELLITVSGIGPKVANSVLSALSPSRFSLAVITSDVSALKSVSGIGLKTAQRIILELKDKMKTEEAISKHDEIGISSDNGTVSEIINALQVLGYTSGEAIKAIKGIDIETLDIETVIKQALRNLSR